MSDCIRIENEQFCLTVGSDAIVRSLICRANGEECLAEGVSLPLCSVTQHRPFNNEIKLAHPNKRMTFNANRIRLEENRLIVGFELIGYEAVIELNVKPQYVAFKLADFIVPYEAFGHLCMTPPPVAEFRILQLPVKSRAKFGEWLNVAWDDAVAVNVLATSPHARIEGEKRGDYRIMSADAVQGVRIRGTEAALICCAKDALMDNIDAFEEDYSLPHGVKNRRSSPLNASLYWVFDMTPANVDAHIARAKQGGFSMMLIYYTCLYAGGGGYTHLGDYDYKDCYPRGAADVKEMLDKIKAAGITPGFHILHTHIGIHSRLVTPVADHRLHLTRNFTLSRPLSEEDTTVYVQENPEDSVMHEKARVLRFGGELIFYDGYSTEYPYCFTGCSRGHLNTNIVSHPLGEIGGILDISEFGATSLYLDQNTDLQDEIADKIADAYNAGFEFIYYDGSEGTNAPFEFHVPNAQYRIYKKLAKEPLFCEGAAKSHFSWHMLSGGNAFDQFRMNIFKEKIVQFPFEEAPRMAQDFTRLNFGWWAFFDDTQADHYEFGTSRAAAWDCPVTMKGYLERMNNHPRTDDILEVLRRWEDARARGLITDEFKQMLRNPDQEHTLLLDGDGYRLVPYTAIDGAVQGNADAAAFSMEIDGRGYAVLWHKTGEGKLTLPALPDLKLEKEPGGEVISAAGEITLAGKIYVSAAVSEAEMAEAIRRASMA